MPSLQCDAFVTIVLKIATSYKLAICALPQIRDKRLVFWLLHLLRSLLDAYLKSDSLAHNYAPYR